MYVIISGVIQPVNYNCTQRSGTCLHVCFTGQSVNYVPYNRHTVKR